MAENISKNGLDNTIKFRAHRQIELCKQQGIPLFAQKDGVCFNCREQIYMRLDGSELITSCPFCNKSYCD